MTDSRVVYRDVNPTPAVEREMADALDEFEHFFHDLVRVEWVLARDHGEAVSRCLVHSRSGYYRAETRAFQMPSSIRETVRKVVTQRRRRKKMRRSIRRGRGDRG